jgi:hypothetical protein
VTYAFCTTIGIQLADFRAKALDTLVVLDGQA